MNAIDSSASTTRRLPVYLLVDTSASMAGAPIEAVQQGITQLHQQLMQMPGALESVVVCVIGFGTYASVIVPLTPVTAFQPPSLTAGGTTSLGAALALMEGSLDTDIRTGSDGGKADWRPLVFMFTDGAPTDDWEPVAERLKQRTAPKINLFVTLASGESVDSSLLPMLTEEAYRLDSVTVDRLKAFFCLLPQSAYNTGDPATGASKPSTVHVPLPPPPPNFHVRL